jgi:hypothetical protein
MKTLTNRGGSRSGTARAPKQIKPSVRWLLCSGLL